MAHIISRTLSLVVVGVYVISYLVTTGAIDGGVIYLLVYLAFPLALIWLPEQIGAITGNLGSGGNINVETPPAIVSFFGWLFLLGTPLLGYLAG